MLGAAADIVAQVNYVRRERESHARLHGVRQGWIRCRRYARVDWLL